jgi:hypothetical protein
MAWKALKTGGTGYWPKKGGRSANDVRKLATDDSSAAGILASEVPNN